MFTINRKGNKYKFIIIIFQHKRKITKKIFPINLSKKLYYNMSTKDLAYKNYIII